MNKLGTYWVTSAHTYWGRVAALLVRLLCKTFQLVEVFMVAVADIPAISNIELPNETAAAIMIFLYEVGALMAWHKTLVQ